MDISHLSEGSCQLPSAYSSTNLYILGLAEQIHELISLSM